MPRQHVVKQLSEEQFEFVINAIVAGDTNRTICAAFVERFEQPLSKSALARWRAAAGDELAERYRLARYQAQQLKADLKDENAETYDVLIRNLEDKLLTATHQVIALDPVKVLKIRQDEEKRRQKDRELGLKERQFAFEQEQARKRESLQLDRFQIAADVWRFVLGYVAEREPTAADALTRHSEELLSNLESHLEAKAA